MSLTKPLSYVLTVTATVALLAGCAAPTDDSDDDVEVAVDTSMDALRVRTPAPGTAARKAILDALRADQKALTGLELIFVVRTMKVDGNWAFVGVSPQSRDGAQHYEDVSALLRRSSKSRPWSVAGYVTFEADEDYATALQGLRDRFPAAPAAIFE